MPYTRRRELERLEKEAERHHMSVEAYRIAEQRAREKAAEKIAAAQRKHHDAVVARRKAEAAELQRQVKKRDGSICHI